MSTRQDRTRTECTPSTQRVPPLLCRSTVTWATTAPATQEKSGRWGFKNTQRFIQSWAITAPAHSMSHVSASNTNNVYYKSDKQWSLCPTFYIFLNIKVIQRRQDGTVNFFMKWMHYKTGFGSAAGEYWLGMTHTLTTSPNSDLSYQWMSLWAEKCAKSYRSSVSHWLTRTQESL